MNIYRLLAEGGAYNLPYLIHIHDPQNTVHFYLVNDNHSIDYQGHTYEASAFNYSPNKDADSSLTLALAYHTMIIDLLENNYYLKAEAVGIFNGEEVEPLSQYAHEYGEATWDGAKLELKFKKDDRLAMSFPALTFNNYNNRGNA